MARVRSIKFAICGLLQALCIQQAFLLQGCEGAIRGSVSVEEEDDFADRFTSFGDVNTKFDKHRAVPYFFMVPKTGTTTLRTHMRKCFHLVSSYEIGDFTTGQSRKADVFMSALPLRVNSEFSSNLPLRMFTFFRDPMERVVSKFFYLQVAEWERKAYNPALKDWSLRNYVESDLHVDNFVTRQLVGKYNPQVELTENDLLHAKQLLTRKCLIGLTSRYQDSLLRFQQYFGWDIRDDPQCGPNSEDKMNANKHRNSDEFGMGLQRELARIEKWDILLYEHALYLFEEQGKILQQIKQIK